MPDDDDSKGAHDIISSTDESGRRDSILSILDNLALCLVRTGTETVAVSLFGKRLEFAGHDLAGQVPRIAIIAAQKEKVDSKSAVEDPTSDLTSYARKVNPMTAVLYQYYSNPGYQDIDFNAHARKVFSLLQHCLRESENFSQQPAESKEAAYILRMEFYRYVIGMSLPKLAVHTEQHDIRSQTTWVGFHAFLKHPVKAEDFEIQANNKLNRINLNPGERQIFCKDDIEFDKAVASIFHNVVSKLLHCIFAYVGILLPKRNGDTKTTNLAVSEEEFGYYLKKLVLSLQDLARFTGLPNGLKYYVVSVKPPCDSSSDGASEDRTTKDEALSHRVNSVKAIKDEQAGDNDTNGAANANSKEPQVEGCCDVSMWRVRYQQWISSIVRQSTAISSLLQLTQKGHTQRIENLSFTPIHTDPPTSGMEDWIQTIKRALAYEIPGSEYENGCDRVIAALQGLCEDADNQEAYSWLDNIKWKFSGNVHCAAMLACMSFTRSPTSSDELKDLKERRLTSKTGVSGPCCYVCSLVLEQAYRYLWLRKPDRVWSCTLPDDCPLKRVKSISEALDRRLSRYLLDSLPNLEKDLKTRSTFVSRSDPTTEQDAGVIGGQEQEDQQVKGS
ncbi:MAG: hypothetical protein Q9198_004303 [Flavoplaca austrocitrina]